MRLLQNILLIAGTTSFGTVAAFLGIAFLISLIQAPGGEPWTRGFGQYIGAMICAPLGLLAGLMVGIGWVHARRDQPNWGRATWVGVFVGLIVGWILIDYWDRHGGMNFWLWTFLFIAAFGTVGGLLASVISLSATATKRQR